MFRNPKSNGGTFRQVISKELEGYYQYDGGTEWVRPVDWLDLPVLAVGQEKFVGLFFITNESSNIRFSVTSDITVDWGDGTIENRLGGASNTSLVLHERVYDYASIPNPEITHSGKLCKQVVVEITPQVAGDLKTFKYEGFKLLDFTIVGSSLTAIDIKGSGVHTLELLGPMNINFPALFSNCSELREVRGTLDTAGELDLSGMFQGCRNLLYPPFFDTSACTDFGNMFATCSRLRGLPEYDTSSGVVFDFFLREARSIAVIPLMDFSSATSFRYMFADCNLLEVVPDFNSSNLLENVESMFSGCYRLKTLPYIDISGVTSAASFISTSGVIVIPDSYANWPNVTNMSGFAGYCRSLIYCPDLNLPSVTNVGGVFQECNSLKNAPRLTFGPVPPNVGYSMFNGCESLTELPSLDSSGIPSFNNMFDDCKCLRFIPDNFSLDSATNQLYYVFYDSGISKIPETVTLPNTVTSFNRTFGYCYDLEEIPAWDLSNITSFTSAFQFLYRLKRFRAYGMKVSFSIDGNNYLDAAGIVEIFNNLADLTGFPTQTLDCSYSLGWYNLTQAEKDIALNKNWTLIG